MQRLEESYSPFQIQKSGVLLKEINCLKLTKIVQSALLFSYRPKRFQFRCLRATLNFQVPRPYISHEVNFVKIAV
ncbi:MAG: hypothetical protein Ct9H90mP16_09980 [Candidatus Poseidoniales archaeon]|nr:MAG: hypothetical protein Ct9H90mP16_09980 [Candidatus Poseidoniales archaeon]